MARRTLLAKEQRRIRSEYEERLRELERERHGVEEDRAQACASAVHSDARLSRNDPRTYDGTPKHLEPGGVLVSMLYWSTMSARSLHADPTTFCNAKRVCAGQFQ